ncbi:hypothetical protein ACLMJK_000051 [Lecanora helva]
MGSSPHDQSSLAEKNQQYWDNVSKSIFKEQWIQDLQQQIFSHLRSNLTWLSIDASATENKKPTKMLDYACGNGIPSKALSPYFTTCIGMDMAQSMVETYNAAAKELGLSSRQMYAIRGDLMAENVDPALLGEEMSGFDLVVICLALHHIEDSGEAIERLVERLRVGGTMLVIDWATIEEKGRGQQGEVGVEERDGEESGHRQQGAGHYHHHHNHQYPHDLREINHPAAHTVAHNSFAKEQMAQAFESAGCGDFEFVLHEKPSSVPMIAGGQMQLFFAKGSKIRA